MSEVEQTTQSQQAPQTTQKPKDRKGSHVSIIYDSNKKTFLGRTAASWAKILLFYLIYYTFLAILIWLFVTQYESRLPQPGSGNNSNEIIFPSVNTRVDQPGSAVFPQNLIADKFDGENKLTLSNKVEFTEEDLQLDKPDWDISFDIPEGQEGNYHYARNMLKFASTYDSSDVDCKSDSNAVREHPCRVSNAELLTFANVKKWLENKTPVVALALNKKLDWSPSNYKLHTELEENSQLNFLKHAVYTHCYETLEDGHRKISADKNDEKYSLFDIKFLENSEMNLNPNFFPYHGNDKKSDNKIRWNKPFTLVQISEKAVANGETTAWKKIANDVTEPDFSRFACYFDANNLDAPVFADKWEEDGSGNTKVWSQGLEKLNMGYVSFHLKYAKDSVAPVDVLGGEE